MTRCKVSGQARVVGATGPQDAQFVARLGVPTEYGSSDGVTYPITGAGAVTAYARSIYLGPDYEPVYFALALFYEPQEDSGVTSGAPSGPAPSEEPDFAMCVVRIGVFESCPLDMGAGRVEVQWSTRGVTVRGATSAWQQLP